MAPVQEKIHVNQEREIALHNKTIHLDSILEHTDTNKNEHNQTPINGVIIGTLTNIGENADYYVDFPDNASGKALLARSTVNLEKEYIGSDIALMFENGNWQKPLIMGPIIKPDHKKKNESLIDKNEKQMNVDIDDERITFNAEKEIVLRCGKSSITLTKAGKVLIRGAYLLSRSSGVNRIKGGSVQLN